MLAFPMPFCWRNTMSERRLARRDQQVTPFLNRP